MAKDRNKVVWDSACANVHDKGKGKGETRVNDECKGLLY